MSDPASIVIPCHPPKIKFLHAFLSSYATNAEGERLPIYIVLTSQGDYPIFAKILAEFSSRLNINYIFVREYLQDNLRSQALVDYLEAGCNKGVAVFKKFVAMHWATNNLKGGVICFDAETYCVRFGRSDLDRVQGNYSSGRYIGLDLEGVGNKVFKEINERSEGLMFSPSELSKIYTWFFDVPYYGVSDLALFFKDAEIKFGAIESFFLALSWHTFEHIAFLYWRVRRGDAILESYNHLKVGAIPEHMGQRGVLSVSSGLGYATSWMDAKQYYKDASPLPPSISFIYHVDRA